MLTAGAIVPHAPVLLEEVSGPTIGGEVAQTVEEVRSLDLGSPEILIVLSPHGLETGVHRQTAGSLSDFGAPGVSIQSETDVDSGRRLGDLWRKPVLDHEVDHGILVPLRLLPSEGVPVIACSLKEEESVSHVRREAEAFASAVRTLVDEGRRIAFVASLNTSTALSPRAPLTDRPEGRALDAAVLDRLSGTSKLTGIPDEMWVSGGSCGAGPFAAWTLLCAGMGLVELSYESPFGVGYVVANARDA
jgi:aromatic ring-opening dioxygenase LigB subunit